MLFIAVIFLDGCKDDDFPVPPASTVPQFTFIIDNESTAPANVVFTNTSIVPVNAGIPDYTWSFGDNSFSKDVNPSHIFEKAGVYLSLIHI